MILDLSKSETEETRVAADVAIIGGGIAGLILAQRLCLKGVKVIVLESGGRKEQHPDPLLTAVEFDRRLYKGATEGRSRCIGGTSVQWGGALLPFRRSDFGLRPEVGHPGWPIEPDELMPYLPTAERMFDIGNGTYDANLPSEFEQQRKSIFVAREAKWPKFSKRNVFTLLQADLEHKTGPQIWLNATATSFNIEDKKLQRVKATNSSGKSLIVSATDFVICAGAIETTRLMLLLEDQNPGSVAGRSHLGRYLQDHLSVPLAQINTLDARRLNSVAGFRFDGPVMRSLRFERDRPNSPGAFVHIAPRPLRVSGFDGAKDFMRSIQRRRPDFTALMRASLDAPYLASLIYWRLFKNRLLWPNHSIYDVHFVTEQAALESNGIKLSARLDKFGVRKAIIDWDITHQDVQIFRDVCADFDRFWTNSSFAELGTLYWRVRPGKLELQQISNAGDIFHPVGTTRMSATSSNGVVDRDLSVFGLDNLSLASTSVLPNGGTANPTMTLIQLTLRLSEKLVQRSDRA